MKHPPGQEAHEIYVVANGEPIQKRLMPIFGPLPVNHLTHNNFGKDLGSFALAAATIPCDLMVLMGAHVHFRRAGWLDRIVSVFLENGPGLYGAWGFHQPATHLRTTFFWAPPYILNSYPKVVGNSQRYSYEHGHDSIVAHVASMGYPVLQVSWNAVLPVEHWRHLENSECLALDQHSDGIGYT